MKQNHIFITGLILLLFLACACTDEQEEVSGDGGKEQGQKVALTLTSLPLQGSGTVTRSEGKGMDLVLGSEGDAETRTVEDENQVSNLCVFQFEGALGSSNAVLIGKTYASGLTSTTFPLILKPFTTHCFLYVCANVGDIPGDYTVNVSTYQDILDASLRVDKQEDFGTFLPMSGCSALIGESAISGNIGITLTRMVAKVTFTCALDIPLGDKFKITGAKLCNVPQTADYVFSDGNVNSLNVHSHESTHTSVTSATTSTYVWYIPENKRGSKTGATSVADRIEKNAPMYASYIELAGTYTHSIGSTPTTYNATYVVYLGNGNMTNYDVERNHHYKVTSTIKGINFADKRVTEYTNLSADGLANCYLASKDNHKYCFNGTVRGNGNTEDYAALQYPTSGISLFPFESVTLTVGEIKDAVLVWETEAGVVNNVRWDNTLGYIKFETGEVKGNALIAVRNTSNEILWSWHIWRTDGVGLKELESYKVKMQTYNNRTIYVMDRNIGSNFANIPPNYADCTGVNALYYQFGRKDPFPVAYSSTTGIQKALTSSNSSGNTALAKSINEPQVFYKCNTTPNNWISTATFNSKDWMISNCLWGDNSKDEGLDKQPWDGKKTIYDPSPAGWRVAPADTWTGILKSSYTKEITLNANFFDYVNAGAFSSGYMVNSNVDSRNMYLPASGLYHYGDGTLRTSGGYKWSASPGGTLERFGLHGMSIRYEASAIYIAKPEFRANGFPVCCAQE